MQEGDKVLWDRSRQAFIWRETELGVFGMSVFIARSVGFIRSAGLLSLALGISGCNMDPVGPRLLLVAPGDQIGARVFIDGEEVGILESQTKAAKLIDKVISKPDFFPKELVSLSIDVSGLPEGDHVVRVVNAGKELIAKTFSVPLSEDELFYAWSGEEEERQ